MENQSCNRCNGLLIEKRVPFCVWYADESEIVELHCINCGNIISEYAIRNKLLNEQRLAEKKKKCNTLRTRKVIVNIAKVIDIGDAL